MSKGALAKCAEWALGKCGYNAKGEEIPDPRPLELPVGFERPETLESIMAGMLKREVQKELHDRGAETFEEADDFEVEDDYPVDAPWQDEMTGKMWTREAEIRAGAVEIPDYEAAKALVAKAKAVLSKYDKDGNLKPVKGKEGA